MGDLLSIHSVSYCAIDILHCQYKKLFFVCTLSYKAKGTTLAEAITNS